MTVFLLCSGSHLTTLQVGRPYSVIGHPRQFVDWLDHVCTTSLLADPHLQRNATRISAHLPGYPQISWREYLCVILTAS